MPPPTLYDSASACSYTPLVFPIVNIGEQSPKPPLSLARLGPLSNTAVPGPAHASAETTALTDHALSHSYSAKFPLVTMRRPIFAPEITPSHGRIPKPHYLPHPWPHPTYHAKWHPDPISRFSTMHQIDTHTDSRQMVNGKCL